mgnify:CR=1 FL=1
MIHTMFNQSVWQNCDLVIDNTEPNKTKQQKKKDSFFLLLWIWGMTDWLQEWHWNNMKKMKKKMKKNFVSFLFLILFDFDHFGEKTNPILSIYLQELIVIFFDFSKEIYFYMIKFEHWSLMMIMFWSCFQLLASFSFSPLDLMIETSHEWWWPWKNNNKNVIF